MRKFILSACLLALISTTQAQVIPGNFIHDGINRVYDVHLPPSWFLGDRPLLLDFHYLGADGRDEDSLTLFNPIADAEGFIVCHPWGFFSDWNVGQQAPYNSGTKDVEFINALIDTLAALYPVDLQRVYAVGMGQGGFMVQRLACALSNRIAAVATVGASMADSTVFYCANSRRIPVMMVNGTADSVVPYYNGLNGYWPPVPDVVNLWRVRNNCGGTETIDSLPDLVNEGSRVVSHRWSCDQNTEVLHYEVLNGGFAWPGASRDLGSGGNRNMDISASQHIWDFLGRFSLTGIVEMEETVEHPATTCEVWPNPSTGRVFISSVHLHSVQIMDIQGKTLDVPVVEKNPSSIEMDLEQLPSGIYWIRADNTVRQLVLMR